MTERPRELLEVGSFQHTPGPADTPSQLSSSRSAGQSAGPNTATALPRRTLLEASNTSNNRPRVFHHRGEMHGRRGFGHLQPLQRITRPPGGRSIPWATDHTTTTADRLASLSLSPTTSTHGATECHARTATRNEYHDTHAIAPGYGSNAESVRRKHAEQADPPTEPERETARQGVARTDQGRGLPPGTADRPGTPPPGRVSTSQTLASPRLMYGFPTSGGVCAWPAA
jgi:hypothetical protein